MKIVAVIPARWHSTRLKGKVLADINGKPMIQHVWERVSRAHEVDEVIVAVDKERVLKVVESFGGKAVFTSPEQPSGTDRIAEVASTVDADIFINVQADEPLIHPFMVDELAQVFEYERNVQIATLVKRIHRREEVIDANVVKCVVDRKGFALYFSRSLIPYICGKGLNKVPAESDPGDISGRYFKHIGLYSYTKDFLFTYTNLPKSTLEIAEKLEQLRVLEHGYKIKTVETRYDTMGVDTQEDLEKVREILKQGQEHLEVIGEQA
ncbi:MAG: 3-deoxy-manno-octulosonate cytidylyltransferase [Candidatus Makaraimicrobium thalassicum]|nr:MAG: 3-deoxy-manno-octulosonate cytidylyltransferase [Candidatus Omnitrophota bacterium]